MTTIALPSGGVPSAVAFDPQDNDMYVSDFSGNAVDVIHGTTVVTTLAGLGWFSGPSGVDFDPGEGEMFVANWGVSNITAIRGTTISGSIPVGLDPEAIADDPYYNSLLVTDYGTSNVTVISSATFPFSATHTSVPVVGPWGIVYDPVHQYHYVGSDGTSNVTILNGLGALIGTIHLGGGGHPFALAFSQAKLHVYVPMAGSHILRGDPQRNYAVEKGRTPGRDEHHRCRLRRVRRQGLRR